MYTPDGRQKAPTTMPMVRLRMLLAQQHLTHEQGGQGDGHHAGADVDADGFLTLGQQAAGQTREGIGHAQAYDGGKGGIDRGGADHVGLSPVARMARPSRVCRNRTKKTITAITAMASTSSLYCSARKVPLQQSPALVNTVSVFVHVQRGGAAHDGDIDGVERC